MTSRVYLLRHGETRWNREDRYTSRTDLPLAEGAREALAPVAARLAGAGIERVLTSPLARARETAAAVAPAGVPVSIDARVREVDFGVFEGRTRSELRTGVDRDAFAAWFRPGHGCPPAPRGETWHAARERALAVLDELAEDPRTTLVVAHGIFLKLLVATAVPALGGAIVRDRHWPNAGVVELLRADGAWSLGAAEAWSAA